MNFFCTKKLFEEINYNIQPIDKKRWDRDPELSSGVGRQMTKRLSKYNMYGPMNSLLIGGGSESKMNPTERVKTPVTALVEKSTDNNITFSLASIPSRESALRQSIASFYDQCDRIFVYLNNYSHIPPFLNDSKIDVRFNQEDIGDIGKFACAFDYGYWFTVDDDIIYPPDYVKRMTARIEKYNRNKIICVHGTIIEKFPIKDFRRDKKACHYKSRLDTDTPVHMVGTGTMAMHTSTMNVSQDMFLKPNMADVWFSLEAQKQKIGLISIERPQKWLIDAGELNKNETIYKSVTAKNKHLGPINDFGVWDLY